MKRLSIILMLMLLALNGVSQKYYCKAFLYEFEFIDNFIEGKSEDLMESDADIIIDFNNLTVTVIDNKTLFFDIDSVKFGDVTNYYLKDKDMEDAIMATSKVKTDNASAFIIVLLYKNISVTYYTQVIGKKEILTGKELKKKYYENGDKEIHYRL